MNRRDFHRSSARTLGGLTLPGWIGGSGPGRAASDGSPPGDAYAAYAPDAKTAAPSIRLSAARSGSAPYLCTLMPLPGWLPDGRRCASADDPALACSVLGRWPDGSASLVVVAGQAPLAAGAQRTLRLGSTGAAAKVALTPARIASLLRSVAVDFGDLGRAEVTAFGQPERIWWANAQTLCARYRAGIAGHATLQAVIDVHAFAGPHALVEVVVENGQMSTNQPTVPAIADYAATVLIDGKAVTTVASAGGPDRTHGPFRSWYASHWVGGDPGVRAHQDTASLQAHPLLHRCIRPGATDMARYANDAYTPWSAGRHRATHMGAGGDHPSIGPLPLWEAHFLQTGDARAARAVEASALAVLGFNVNYRDSRTGTVPDAAQLAGKYQTGYGKNWPSAGSRSGAMDWELAHHPAAGLMAFVCRPSPVFIEIAQKVAVWNGTWNCDPLGLKYGWNGPAAGVNDMTGIFGASSQLRGRAWGLRSLAHATFLSPAGSAWRSGGQVWLDRNRRFLDAWRSDPKATLNTMWDEAPTAPGDVDAGMPGFQISMWMVHFLVIELHKAAAARLLPAENQAALDRLADWACLQPVRWINEQPNGGWRFNPYRTRLGNRAGAIDAHATWAEQRAADLTGAPSSVQGPWGGGLGDETTWSAVETRGGLETSAGSSYGSLVWCALVAAVERGLPGSKTAWTTVQAGITSLTAWTGGFATDPRWGSTPRNL